MNYPNKKEITPEITSDAGQPGEEPTIETPPPHPTLEPNNRYWRTNQSSEIRFKLTNFTSANPNRTHPSHRLQLHIPLPSETAMQTANRFLSELRSSKLSLGAWQMFPSPSASRSIARVPGISWVLIDQEHGNVSDSAMHECIASIAPYGVSPLVRLPDSQRWMIKRALDAGAHGIMIPLLSTVEEVEEVVRQVNQTRPF